ncbi:RNA-binding protein CP29B, chloroplastic-like [Rosa rugosa]|uniref:RNA-binding protein CP29B, chloroplastic-like n=1 Tax=Rosa rugosa TaxID=74645 RepID=UPI002B405B85|nr:RNA-binding protein CP29B, chloroplastic-like [Rosa rugosa]
MIPKNSVHGAFDSSVQVLLYFLTDLNLFVGNLPFTVDSAQLVELFKGAGNVEMVEVMHDKTTGRSRGFGFVSHHLGSQNFGCVG